MASSTESAGEGNPDDDVGPYLEASIDDLSTTPAVRSPASPEKSFEAAKDQQKIKEHKDAPSLSPRPCLLHHWCGQLSWFGIHGLYGRYTISQWGQIQPTVVVGYFSSVVVQVIGILWVISRYLFPESGPPEL